MPKRNTTTSGSVGFIGAALATWRVAHLVYAEDGPGDLVIRLRRRAGNSLAGQLMDSFYSASLVAALPAALLLGENRRRRLLYWPALSAAAILLERGVSALDPGLEPDLQLLPTLGAEDLPLFYEDIREEVE
ncbi:hypothetical protein SAMN05892883_0756 [Jatrophihabitans sp. GAS493]|uniref:hypothetical protein n=1 Tax=Jatrophihabitans sp. GAS493 TaxID=1907575 RepID=UPI000BC026E9|nr:hypothetical protein [Jatrophihabitans sp. GAS493]SOD71190.1 hypothetical protein SAMN05892883_0756 [Jatrophihabitans sp. GAS493]